MKLKRVIGTFIVLIAAVVMINAQETTTTTSTTGPASHQIAVERGEIVYISGNEVVVRMENGEIREFTAAPGATAIVDGKKITIADAKPGMKLERTITTTTTPRTVTTIRTIHGKVWHVNAPKSVILTLPDGQNKQYNVPKDQKFMINGAEKTVFELRKGMIVNATVLVSVPETVVAQEKRLTGKMPPPPPTPPMESAILIEQPAPVQVAEAEAPAKLPKTGSEVPLLGLFGILSLAGSGLLSLLKRK